jgi:hypothetical protein
VNLQDQATLAAWPTPNTPNGGRSVPIETLSATGLTTDGRKHTVSLEHVAKFAAWPTATTQDNDQVAGEYGPNNSTTLGGAARLAIWPTATAGDAAAAGGQGSIARGNRGESLTAAARLATWATPAQRDYRTANRRSYADRGGQAQGEQLANQVVHAGPTSSGSPAATGKPGQLNPAFSLWLMGYPVVAWLLAAPSSRPQPRYRRRKPRTSSAAPPSSEAQGTRSFRKSRPHSSRPISTSETTR